MEELYIRNPTETEARGPYNLEKVTSLAEAGQVTPETLFYDTTTEQWSPIGANEHLKGLLFPEKRKLTVRAKQKLETLNEEKDTRPPITVDDMLAAAEGRTAETKDKKDPAEAMARAANLGRWSAVVMLLVCAAGEVLPSTDLVMAMDPAKLLAHPLVLFGGLDLALGVLLSLGVVSIYPFVRFRAALGLGFLGFIFWTHGQPASFALLCAGSAGLYLSTVFVSYVPVIIAAAAGLGGLGLLAWKFIST